MEIQRDNLMRLISELKNQISNVNINNVVSAKIENIFTEINDILCQPPTPIEISTSNKLGAECDIIDDLWMNIFKFLDPKSFIFIQHINKHFYILFDSKQYRTVLNKYWKRESKQLFPNMNPKYSTNKWFQCYIELVLNHQLIKCIDEYSNDPNFDPMWTVYECCVRDCPLIFDMYFSKDPTYLNAKIKRRHYARYGDNHYMSNINTPMLLSIENDSINMVEYLLKCNIEMFVSNDKNIISNSPLIMACVYSFYDIAKLLLSHINTKTKTKTKTKESHDNDDDNSNDIQCRRIGRSRVANKRLACPLLARGHECAGRCHDDCVETPLDRARSVKSPRYSPNANLAWRKCIAGISCTGGRRHVEKTETKEAKAQKEINLSIDYCEILDSNVISHGAAVCGPDFEIAKTVNVLYLSLFDISTFKKIHSTYCPKCKNDSINSNTPGFLMASLLIKTYNADINIKFEEGNVLQIAIKLYNQQLRELDKLKFKQIKDEKDETEIKADRKLITCLSKYYFHVINFLLTDDDCIDKIDINANDNNNYSPLYYACKHDLPDIVKLLLNHPKCDLFVKSLANSHYGKNMTILMIAAAKGNIYVVKQIESHIMKNMDTKYAEKDIETFVNATNAKGQTAQQIAVFMMRKMRGRFQSSTDEFETKMQGYKDTLHCLSRMSSCE